MIWTTYHLPPPKYPYGLKRVVRGFAWIPTPCKDGKTRWLEPICRLQVSWGFHVLNWGTYETVAGSDYDTVKSKIDEWNTAWLKTLAWRKEI